MTIARLFPGPWAVVAMLVGCGSPDSDGTEKPPAASNDHYEAELFPSTRVLGDDTLDALLAFDADGTLRFSGSPAELANMEPWQVVAGGVSDASPSGFLRVVTAVESDSAGVVLRTVQAPIQLAFRKLKATFTRRVDDLGDPGLPWTWAPRRSQAFGSAWPSKSLDFYDPNGDGDTTTTDDQVHVTGELNGGFAFTFDLDVDWDEVYEVPDEIVECLKNSLTGQGCSPMDLLPEAKVDFAVTAGANATLSMEGVAFLPYEVPYTLGEVKLPKIVFPPLVFVPTVEVKALIQGGATSQFSFQVGAHADSKIGVTVYSKNPVPKVTGPTADWGFDAPSVDATLKAGGRVAVGPELHVRLYGMAGPYAGITAFAELSAEQSRSPCYELHAGASATYGFTIVTPDLPVIGHATLAHWNDEAVFFKDLADSGACKPLPGGDAPSPTAGDPDAATFANPTFSPWSTTYASATYSHPYGSPGALIAWIDAVPTVDGRFVVAGSESNALLKLSPDGTVVWAKRYLGPEVYNDTLNNQLLVNRVLHRGNASMLVVGHPYVLLNVDAAGNVLWSKRFDVPYRGVNLRLTSIGAASDGGFFVGGNAGETPADNRATDAWLLRFDATGNVIWSRSWGTTAEGETLRSLVALGDGVVASGATWMPTDSNWRAWTVRFDAAGNVAWSKTYDARPCGSIYESSVFVTASLVARDGDLVFAGSIEDARRYTLVFKVKPDGTLSWFASDGASRSVDLGPRVSGIVELPTSGYLLAGGIEYSPAGTYSDSQDDWWLGAADGLGRLQWLQRYGGEKTPPGDPFVLQQTETYPSVLLTRDGGALMVGYTDALAPSGQGVWVQKVPAKDGLITLDATTTARTSSVGFTGSQNCFTQSDAPITPQDYAVTPQGLAVTVESVTVPTASLAN